MAKAKPSSTNPAAAKKPATPPAAEAKSAPKAPAKKAPAKKPATVAAQSGMPQIDTNLAAQSAATMLRNRGSLGGASANQNAKETSTFKNLKDQIANPKSAALTNIMGTPGEQKKGGSHFLNQQRGHNQTQGGFNKTGVPRRTNG